MRKKVKKLVAAFDTTSQAMKMEREAQKAGLLGRLIPVPPQIRAGCGLAFCTSITLRQELEKLLCRENIRPEGLYEVFL
jgi:hypothetical protein